MFIGGSGNLLNLLSSFILGNKVVRVKNLHVADTPNTIKNTLIPTNLKLVVIIPPNSEPKKIPIPTKILWYATLIALLCGWTASYVKFVMPITQQAFATPAIN